uniref:Putative competence protein CoiA-like family protein n=1 Tax=viral metagenome TaxID=1070528 RepID=A0A6M3Y563_9ZZZZ
MLYALCNDERHKASPGTKGDCPWCSGGMIPKCGDVMIWHWAHKTNPCDTKEETEWHLEWKSRFLEDWAEVKVEHENKYKIADVKTDYQRVIEFQHSPISYEDARSREECYGYMAWVLNVSQAYQDERIWRNGGDTLIWERPKRNWTYFKKPVFLDFGDGNMFEVESFVKTIDSDDVPILEIEGRIWDKDDFIADLIAGPKELVHGCNYKNRSRLVHYRACQWHRNEHDEECRGCGHWKYPHYQGSQLLKQIEEG